MLVKDLIEELKKIDPEKGVILVSCNWISCLTKIQEDGDCIFLEGKLED